MYFFADPGTFHLYFVSHSGTVRSISMNRSPESPLLRPIPVRRGHNVWLRRALIFATTVVLVNALVGQGGLIESLRARHEYSDTFERLTALQRENESLADRMRKLAGDARTIEGVAREDLGLIRPGEVMFVLK